MYDNSNMASSQERLSDNRVFSGQPLTKRLHKEVEEMLLDRQDLDEQRIGANSRIGRIALNLPIRIGKEDARPIYTHSATDRSFLRGWY